MSQKYMTPTAKSDPPHETRSCTMKSIRRLGGRHPWIAEVMGQELARETEIDRKAPGECKRHDHGGEGWPPVGEEIAPQRPIRWGFI